MTNSDYVRTIIWEPSTPIAVAVWTVAILVIVGIVLWVRRRKPSN
jgi:hypothetical protein